MKIGIVGPADRAVAWEEHLRPHQTVSEVVIAPTLDGIGRADACFLLDESSERLEKMLKAVKDGYNCFLISKLPTDTRQIEKVYHAAEEANVHLQFSHWPTLAPATEWMAQKISKPSFIQINREISHTHFIEMSHDFDFFWIDELAFCLKWIDGAVHHLDLKTVELGGEHMYAIHLFLRFDSGATSSIFINTAADRHNHHRYAANQNYYLDCDVLEQSVRWGQQNKSGHLFFKKQSFDASKAAERAAMQFIKSIQLNKPSIYNGYHLLKLANEIDRIKRRLTRV